MPTLDDDEQSEVSRPIERQAAFESEDSGLADIRNAPPLDGCYTEEAQDSALRRKAPTTFGLDTNVEQLSADERQAYLRWATEALIACRSDERNLALKTGRLLARLWEILDFSDFWDVCRSVGYDSLSTVQNLVRVGKCKLFQNPEFEPHLPYSVGALIDLSNATRWTETAFRTCLAQGHMRPRSTRAQLQGWIDWHEAGIQLTEKGPPIPITPYEAGCVVYFHHRVRRKDRSDFWRHVFRWQPPGLAQSEQPDSPHVVLRKLEPKDMGNDVYDRFCDEEANIVHENGEWKSPTRIRCEGETVLAEPWDFTLGSRPGDRD